MPVTALSFLVVPCYIVVKVTCWLYAALAVAYIWVAVLMLERIVFFPSFLELRLVIFFFFFLSGENHQHCLSLLKESCYLLVITDLVLDL